MSIRLANFDHKASLSLREPHKLGWKLADHIPGDGLATELLVFEQFVYLYCNHSTEDSSWSLCLQQITALILMSSDLQTQTETVSW